MKSSCTKLAAGVPVQKYSQPKKKITGGKANLCKVPRYIFYSNKYTSLYSGYKSHNYVRLLSCLEVAGHDVCLPRCVASAPSRYASRGATPNLAV